MLRLLLLVHLIVGLGGCFDRISLPKSDEYISGGSGWILSPEAAQIQLANGALLLDARSTAAYQAGHLKGAVHADWLMFSDPQDPLRGRLLSDIELLQTRIRALGVRSDRAILVVGDPISGWGESGRIVWMLRTVGHSQVALVDGGHQALQKLGRVLGSTKTPTPSEFVVKSRGDWQIKLSEFRDLVSGKIFVDGSQRLLDTRELREFNGETPYGETRGGHVPGARHLHYKSLIAPNGRLFSRDIILSRFAELGLTKDKPVIVYCTGGVRSAWVVGLMIDLGFKHARNYGGSMWEWAASDPTTHPLTTAN